jgi:hypothetical protein
MMSRLSSVVKQHPLVTFFVLAYALSWWAWIPYTLGFFPNPVASFGPFLAAHTRADGCPWQEWRGWVAAPDGALAHRA